MITDLTGQDLIRQPWQGAIGCMRSFIGLPGSLENSKGGTMPSSILQGWAPPGFWGPWITVDQGLYGGQFTMELSFDSESDAAATFDIEVKYYLGNEEKIDRTMGPGSHSIGFGLCACKVKVRMKSHLLGQNVRIIARHP